MARTAEPSHYDLLGIPSSAEDEALRQAYRRAARRHHPDLMPQDAGAQQRMAAINEAYAVLSHPQRRASYDQWLRARDARSRAEEAVAAAQPTRFASGWPWGLVAATMAIALGTVGAVLYRTAHPTLAVAAQASPTAKFSGR
jgi:curved DNA-binding protein CbpA